MAKLITSAEAAKLLKVSQVRVQALCRQRRIPGARLLAGRTWMLPADFKVTPGTRGPRLKGKR
jgi:excisionase family DNA binding protein